MTLNWHLLTGYTNVWDIEDFKAVWCNPVAISSQQGLGHTVQRTNLAFRRACRPPSWSENTPTQCISLSFCFFLLLCYIPHSFTKLSLSTRMPGHRSIRALTSSLTVTVSISLMDCHDKGLSCGSIEMFLWSDRDLHTNKEADISTSLVLTHPAETWKGVALPTESFHCTALFSSTN